MEAERGRTEIFARDWSCRDEAETRTGFGAEVVPLVKKMAGGGDKA